MAEEPLPTQRPMFFDSGSMPPPGTNRWSVVALVSGVLGVWPLAFGSAAAAIRQTNRSGQGGRGKAIWGIVVGAVWLVAQSIILWSVLGPDVRWVEFSDLRPGDCTVSWDITDSTVIRGLEVVPCSQPHHAEVYAAFPLPTAAIDDALAAWAEERCSARLAEYSAVAAKDDSLQTDIFASAPDDPSRVVVCIAVDANLRTGSIAT